MGRRAFLGLVLITLVGVIPVPSVARENLLLITIDTIRADHLGCNGSAKARTPNLDRLAREGVNFTRARSPVPLTLPAHASILTGNYPPTHSVRSNGEYRLPEEQTSLAEVLRGQGYQTAAFLASFVLDSRFGLAQGFDHYDDRVWSDVEELEELEAERDGEEVLTAFSEWLAGDNGSGPFFVWIHLYDPHAPYEPPEPYRTQYPGDPYSGEVAYTDWIVGEIVSELQRQDRWSNTLIAITGDHGEGLGDHGEMTHSLLIYNSTLHVPMMIRAPGKVPAGRTVEDLVRVIDLAPTLLDYLGIQEAFGEGISLRSMMEAGVDEAAREIADLTAYSESYYPELALGWSSLRGLESRDHRLILAPKPVLFDLEKDPGETLNTIDNGTAVYQHLKKQLMESILAWAQTTGTSEPARLDAESRERLESLGYLSNSGRRSARRGPRRDPNESIDLWNQIQRGIALVGAAEYRRAIDVFESVLADDPDIPLVYEYLGTCWREVSNDDQAEKVYRQAISRGIESPRLHSELGRILFQRGEVEPAERELLAAAALDPRSVVSHYDLGNLYRRQQEFSRAAEQYRVALGINPDYVWGWNGLAMSLAALNQHDGALEAFRRVVEIDSTGAAGFFNLAVHLERLDQRPEAAQAFARFLELSKEGELEVQRRQAREAIERLTP